MSDTPGELSFDQLRAVLAVALRAGQLLLTHGADAHRVEETVHHIGTGLGAVGLEVYVTPTGIIASATNGYEHRTNIRRVAMGSVDLSRIEAINQLSRRIKQDLLDHHAVGVELERIAHAPRNYGRWTTVAIVALACGCFSQLFGGGWREFMVAFCAGGVALLVRQELVRREVGPLLEITPAAFSATSVAGLMSLVIGPMQFDIGVPAGILPLVPGVPLINALSDLLANDYVSGVTRVAQAILIAAEIAVGVALALDIARVTGLGG